MLLLLGFTLAVSGCARSNGEADQGNAAAAEAAAGPVTGVLDRSHAGRPAPAFAFEDPQGKPTSMAAFRGRPVLVNLWATWCRCWR
jgi:cytochrome oxidase Cu insertion factor (SCO1/SenC/PrrC family)